MLHPRFAFLNEYYRAKKGVQVVVDGQLLSPDKPPIIVAEGRMLVPAKPVLTAMGARVEWLDVTRTMHAMTRYGEVTLKPDLAVAYIAADNRRVPLDQAPVIRDGTLFVPVKEVIALLGGSYDWRPEENTLYIRSLATPPAAAPAPALAPAPLPLPE